jgi:hypothetical protein
MEESEFYSFIEIWLDTMSTWLTASSAGSGSSGADGGNGGSIDILVAENMTHLLIAAEWDIRGGSGGPPGHHGSPGNGGSGGVGGAAYEWYSYLARFVCGGYLT